MTRTTQINGTPIHHEVRGDGDPLVLVHGSWGDAVEWEAVAGPLSQSFRVISYDRRGHSRSRPAPEDHTRRTDEDDLAAIIESIAGGRSHVVANSFGGLITLGLAARRPELMLSISVHEPPALSVVDAGDGDTAELMPLVGVIVEQIQAGDTESAARLFMEEVALGPGSWDILTERERSTFSANAPTFAGEMSDPAALDVDTEALARGGIPTQVTKGTDGPAHLQALADGLARALPHAEMGVIEGAGHAPHETHPREFIEVVAGFVRSPVSA